jgi:peptide/nickel transport system ATP-binding protein
MIFQEPMASFSPVYTIGNQIGEAVRLHRAVRRAAIGPMGITSTVGAQISETVRGHSKVSAKEAKAIAIEMLERVGISNASLRVNQYSHELSGGMRQRAMIAVALSSQPAVLVADEPTTALDVTIQAQILELLNELQEELGMSIIFITHDLGVIAQIADEVAVMYLGTIVERGPTKILINDPKHPYTVGLLQAIPRLDRLEKRLRPVTGDIPGPMERPAGCGFHPRCPQAKRDLCDRVVPTPVDTGDGRQVSCLLYGGAPA